MMGTAWSCLRGPRLLRLGGGVDYMPGAMESYGDTILTSLSCAATVLVYTSPLVLPWAYRRGWMTEEGGLMVGKLVTGLGLVVVAALVLRTLGRLSTPAYTQFAGVLSAAQGRYTEATRAAMERYDFHFSAWPVDFDVRQEEGDGSKPLAGGAGGAGGGWGPLDGLAYLLMHSFGISLVYPGSMGLMGMMVERPLLEGRTKLVQDGGRRFKVMTRDGNQIDTMFVQQQTRENGKTLVICCEGNAGFYEIGMMGTPVSAGYSVLGWNHPGFSGSTGRPYPDQEVAAADAVMQFAIQKLGFLPEDIIVYGWSIGGFTASWLAMTYPSVRGLILDATFDELEPLAVPRMPAAMAGLVSRAVTSYVRLDVAAQTVAFPGPLRLIRRNRDEMIATVQGEVWSNRGNALLEAVLEARHPSLASTAGLAGLRAVLYSPGALTAAGSQEAEAAYLALAEAEAEEAEAGAALPGDQQAVILGFLASKLMTEVDTTHCTPLPTAQFVEPWRPRT